MFTFILKGKAKKYKAVNLHLIKGYNAGVIIFFDVIIMKRNNGSMKNSAGYKKWIRLQWI